MPIWLRRFTFNQIKEHYEKEANPNKEDVISQNRKTMKSANATSEKQSFNVPSYVVKASKK